MLTTSHVSRLPNEPPRVIHTAPVQQPQIVVVQKGSSGFNALMWLIVISIIAVGMVVLLFTGVCCLSASGASVAMVASSGALSNATSMTT